MRFASCPGDHLFHLLFWVCSGVCPVIFCGHLADLDFMAVQWIYAKKDLKVQLNTFFLLGEKKIPMTVLAAIGHSSAADCHFFSSLCIQCASPLGWL